MTEYAIYKSRIVNGNKVWVELYRCECRKDTEVRFTEYLSGKIFTGFEMLPHETSAIMADTTTYTLAEELS